MQGRVQESQY